MGKSRSRLAADWFAKLRVNTITQEVEHEDVVAEQEAIAAAEAKIASDIVTAKALADSEMATAIAGATMASSDILTSLKTVDGSGSGLDADLLDGIQGDSFLLKSGGTMTGILVGRDCTTTTVAAANDAGSMSIRGSTTTPAVVSFHRAGAYAINFGLSTANKMEMGGWSASTIKHTWDMSGNYTAVGNITAYSDIRVKTNIAVIPEALDKVKQLSGYTFDRTDFIPDAETGVMPETRQTGVIAQEVLKVLPEAVTTMDDGKYAVAYGNMVGLLIEAIKELSAKVEELENK